MSNNREIKVIKMRAGDLRTGDVFRNTVSSNATWLTVAETEAAPRTHTADTVVVWFGRGKPDSNNRWFTSRYTLIEVQTYASTKRR